MKIFILRHGHAEPNLINDKARSLTPKGIADTHWIIQKNKTQLSAVTKILTSPLVRAQQTASIADSYLSVTEKTTWDWLQPESNVNDVWMELQKISSEAILIVSHLPLVGLLANQLCGYASGKLYFETSSLVGIECELPAQNMGTLFLESHCS